MKRLAPATATPLPFGATVCGGTRACTWPSPSLATTWWTTVWDPLARPREPRAALLAPPLSPSLFCFTHALHTGTTAPPVLCTCDVYKYYLWGNSPLLLVSALQRTSHLRFSGQLQQNIFRPPPSSTAPTPPCQHTPQAQHRQPEKKGGAAKHTDTRHRGACTRRQGEGGKGGIGRGAPNAPPRAQGKGGKKTKAKRMYTTARDIHTHRGTHCTEL